MLRPYPLSYDSTLWCLQVLSRSGSYLDVPLVPGAVLVNIADLMQRWTSDRFVSAVSGCGLFIWGAGTWGYTSHPLLISSTGFYCPLLETTALASLWPSSCSQMTTL